MWKKTGLVSAALVLACFGVTHADTLLSYDFNGKDAWPAAATDVQPSTPVPVDTTIVAKPVGTIDVSGSTEPSGGLLLTADVGDIKEPWEADFTSGLLPMKNAVADLAKLTLAFDLSASTARPVIVRLTYFDSQKRPTGTLETTIYPAAPDFYQRSAIDLSMMHTVGEKNFRPADPFVQITFAIASLMFVSPITDAVGADFKLKPGSPAVGHGVVSPLVPLTDITVRPRPLDKAPDAGAYQQ